MTDLIVATIMWVALAAIVIGGLNLAKYFYSNRK